MLTLFVFWLGLSADAQLRPTQTLLEESTQLNTQFYGGYDGVGGGDLMDVRKLTAWFYGSSPIKTCFHVTEQFGLDSSKIEELINKASRAWSSFFTKKNINSYYEVPINTNLSVTPTCKGGEDLVLYFGTGPIFGNLNDMRARQLLVRPVAYVNKTHMSEDLLWARGYIRFVEPFLYLNNNGRLYPDWSNEEKTSKMIEHELGHVFGFLHAGDSIMTSNIAQELFVLNDEHSTKTSKERLFPKPENKVFLAPTNNDPLWKEVKRIELRQSPTEVFINSIKVNSSYELSNTAYPLIANIHQNTPVSFSQTRLIFFNYQNRHFTLEQKESSVEIRENGNLILEAVRKED